MQSALARGHPFGHLAGASCHLRAKSWPKYLGPGPPVWVMILSMGLILCLEGIFAAGDGM
eukprot:1743955-Amphidinium_carterae.1